MICVTAPFSVDTVIRCPPKRHRRRVAIAVPCVTTTIVWPPLSRENLPHGLSQLLRVLVVNWRIGGIWLPCEIPTAEWIFRVAWQLLHVIPADLGQLIDGLDRQVQTLSDGVRSLTGSQQTTRGQSPGFCRSKRDTLPVDGPGASRALSILRRWCSIAPHDWPGTPHGAR